MTKPRVKKRSIKKMTKSKDLSRAILLIRWSHGNDVREISEAVAAFRADKQIAIYDATDSDDLLDIIQNWLSAKKSQVLFIGAHGNREGLKPTPNDYPTLTWERLAQTLETASAPLWVCFGSCNSAYVASSWATLKNTFPVSVFFGFRSDKTTEDEVGNVLLQLLEVTGVYTAGSEKTREKRQEITTLEEDFRPFQSISNRLVIYKRNLSSGVYEMLRGSPLELDNSDAAVLSLSTKEILDEAIVDDLLGEEIDDGEPDRDLS
jgi:hypothetical protein